MSPVLAPTSLFIPVFSSFWIVLSFSFYGSHFWILDCKLIQMKLLFHYLPPCVWVLSVELFHRSTGGCNASTKAGKKSVKLADIEVKDARLKIHQMLSECFDGNALSTLGYSSRIHAMHFALH